MTSEKGGGVARSPRDTYGRTIDYLRISVTDRCNLRCVYCMPATGVVPIAHDEILRYEEILTVVDAARSLGVRRFRVTGGEPLVRKGLIWFLERLSERGVDYSITTNGVLLGRCASDLKRAGLTRINVGLDSLSRPTFARITGQDALLEVLRGIDAARAEGITSVKINVVVMRDINETEIEQFIRWGAREGHNLRFIEFMPACGGDLFVSLEPFVRAFSGSDEVEAVEERGGGPAKTFRHRAHPGTVGFILPRSRPFCAACNRLRLTADGTLLPCLFSPGGVSVKKALRRGDPVEQIILQAVAGKPKGHELNMKLYRYAMHAVGG